MKCKNERKWHGNCAYMPNNMKTTDCKNKTFKNTIQIHLLLTHWFTIGNKTVEEKICKKCR